MKMTGRLKAVDQTKNDFFHAYFVIILSHMCRLSHRKASDDTLLSDCNSNCSCTYTKFAPVCGADDVTYYNPCAAGCLVRDERSGADVSLRCFLLGYPVRLV